jgi:uncharacterized protein (TIGR02611 family)
MGRPHSSLSPRQGLLHQVGFLHWVHERREKLILGNAYHLLDVDEDIIHWVRISQPGTRRQGFAFMTPRQVIVHWNGRSSENTSFTWSDIQGWAVNLRSQRGCLFAVEGDDFDLLLELPADTHATAHRVNDFLRRFARLAPSSGGRPDRAPSHDRNAEWISDGEFEVSRVSRSPVELARRIVVTCIGVALIITGILIIPLPGPWSFFVNLGGLAVLASEYDWAKDAQMWVRKKYEQAKEKIQKRRAAGSQPRPGR